MPLSRRIAKLNKIGLNRVTRHVAPWLPGFGVVVHRGRKSGRSFRTPVNVFRRPTGYVIALTYGSQADWVRNVLAAGGCDLVSRRRTVHLVEPRLVRDQARPGIPAVPRTILGAFNVDEFLLLDNAGDASLKNRTPRPG